MFQCRCLEFEILVCLAVLFVSLKNRQNWMHITHRSLSNLHPLGRTAHQNRIHHKKLKYRNCFGNRCLWFGVAFFVVAIVFGFFFFLSCSLLGNTSLQAEVCIVTFNFDNKSNSQLRRQVRPETNTVNTC